MDRTHSVLSALYFHEQDVRERIIGRVQINFGVYITFLAMVAYMTRMMDFQCNILAIYFFYFFLGMFFLLIFISINYSIKAFVGTDYRNFPKAEGVIKYHIELTNRVDEIREYNNAWGTSETSPDPTKQTDTVILNNLAKCIDYNSEVNERRRMNIKTSIMYSGCSVIPLLLLSSTFVMFDLDVSSPRKNTLVQDTSVSKQLIKLSDVIESKNVIITDNK